MVEGDIDEYLNNLEQDDPILIEAIQNYYLDKPNENFSPNIPQDRLTPNALAVSYSQPNMCCIKKIKNLSPFWEDLNVVHFSRQ